MDYSSARFCIGLDLGGSGTRAALATSDGEILALGHGPPAGYATRAAGRRQVARSLAAALASIAPRVVGQSCSVWAGTTGLSIPGRGEWLILELTTRLPGAHVEVSSDAQIALAGGLGAQSGVAVLAGTGSIALARGHDGRLARTGGWGYLLGDEGSAFWLGREALRATLGANEGRLADGELTRSVRQRLGRDSPIAWATRDERPAGHIATLAPLVTRAAEAGDPVAGDIVQRAAAALAEMAAAAARQASLNGPVRVVPVGGVWSAGDTLTRPFAVALQRYLPETTIQPPTLPPTYGALLLAIGAPTPAVVERLSTRARL